MTTFLVLFGFLSLSSNVLLVLFLLKSFRDRDKFAEEIYRDITKFQVEEV